MIFLFIFPNLHHVFQQLKHLSSGGPDRICAKKVPDIFPVGKYVGEKLIVGRFFFAPHLIYRELVQLLIQDWRKKTEIICELRIPQIYADVCYFFSHVSRLIPACFNILDNKSTEISLLCSFGIVSRKSSFNINGCFPPIKGPSNPNLRNLFIKYVRETGDNLGISANGNR